MRIQANYSTKWVTAIALLALFVWGVHIYAQGDDDVIPEATLTISDKLLQPAKKSGTSIPIPPKTNPQQVGSVPGNGSIYTNLQRPSLQSSISQQELQRFSSPTYSAGTTYPTQSGISSPNKNIYNTIAPNSTPQNSSVPLQIPNNPIGSGNVLPGNAPPSDNGQEVTEGGSENPFQSNPFRAQLLPMPSRLGSPAAPLPLGSISPGVNYPGNSSTPGSVPVPSPTFTPGTLESPAISGQTPGEMNPMVPPERNKTIIPNRPIMSPPTRFTSDPLQRYSPANNLPQGNFQQPFVAPQPMPSSNSLPNSYNMNSQNTGSGFRSTYGLIPMRPDFQTAPQTDNPSTGKAKILKKNNTVPTTILSITGDDGSSPNAPNTKSSSMITTPSDTQIPLRRSSPVQDNLRTSVPNSLKLKDQELGQLPEYSSLPDPVEGNYKQKYIQSEPPTVNLNPTTMPSYGVAPPSMCTGPECQLDNCCVCGPPGRFWLSADYLYWVASGNHIPPLVTASPPGTPQGLAGVLGAPGTRVLFGGNNLVDPWQSGFRFNTGYWLNQNQTFGIDVGGFFLGQASSNASFSSAGTPGSTILARPFFDTLGQQQFSQLVAFPGILAGTATSLNNSSLWGADVNLRKNLFCSDCSRLDLLFGAAFLQLQDQTEVLENLVTTSPNAGTPIGTNISVFDQFRAINSFYGPQIGLAGEIRRSMFFVNGTMKLAAGVSHQTLDVDGVTRVTVPGAGTTATPGGLLALPSNIGTYHYDRFAVVPQGGINVGIQVTRYLRVQAGYTFIYWSQVIRSGDMINTNINPTQIPRLQPATAIQGSPQPVFMPHYSDYWIQGVNFGATLLF